MKETARFGLKNKKLLNENMHSFSEHGFREGI